MTPPTQEKTIKKIGKREIERKKQFLDYCMTYFPNSWLQTFYDQCNEK